MLCCADVDGTLFAGTNIGILMCAHTDSLDTWKETTTPLQARVNAIASTDYGLIALTSKGFINGAAVPAKTLLSVSGTSWEQSGSDLTGNWGVAASNGPTAVAIDYGNPAKVMTFGM